MGVGQKSFRIPITLSVSENKVTINPYYVWFFGNAKGFPKEIFSLKEYKILWTEWHEVWFKYFELREYDKSGNIKPEKLQSKCQEILEEIHRLS